MCPGNNRSRRPPRFSPRFLFRPIREGPFPHPPHTPGNVPLAAADAVVKEAPRNYINGEFIGDRGITSALSFTRDS